MTTSNASVQDLAWTHEGNEMTIEEFIDEVQSFADLYLTDYPSKFEIGFSEDEDGIFSADITISMMDGSAWIIPITQGEGGEIVVTAGEESTLDLSPESVFAVLWFEAMNRMEESPLKKRIAELEALSEGYREALYEEYSALTPRAGAPCQASLIRLPGRCRCEECRRHRYLSLDAEANVLGISLTKTDLVQDHAWTTTKEIIMTEKQKTEFDRGWAAGVIFAAAWIARDHGLPSIAEEMLDLSIRQEDFQHGDEYDIEKLREAKVKQVAQ